VPELPEVEVLVRSLGPRLLDQTICRVRVLRHRVLRPTSARQLVRTLKGGRFLDLSRRGKYLLFAIQRPSRGEPLLLVGHLGMTGRIYVQPVGMALPKHAAVVLGLDEQNLVFEDTRCFGRMTLDTGAIEKLGPEPLGPEFTVERFTQALARSSQPVKVKLLDQHFVAGIGNIYASEALFRARISPRLAARRLTAKQIERLWRAIGQVLAEAIEWGSTVRLDYPSTGSRDGLFYFYFGGAEGEFGTERLRVYDRAGQPCSRCKAKIKRLVQAGRSTFYCPACQRG
jgi:formamidopyrimidine-DNA glycosylase